MSYTIVGVIGHIDHGKTSLVAALTGVDTDTHPEEKNRGITIDLGFAAFTNQEHTFALVDAPGHQKYIGNLLAGVSGVDVGLLVVAADQGIQAQTLEHAAILQSLGVSNLIVVISRIDLADVAIRESLREELELFLSDFGYAEIPMVEVSTLTLEGLNELRSLLVEQARTQQRVASSYFRMPVDRAFTIEGRGTVIAGTPWSGVIETGGYLEVVRTGDRIRVREMEVHGQSVDRSELGMRTAMNVVGVDSGVVRGDELVSPGTHRPASRLIAKLTMFRDASEIRCPTTIHLHTATCMGAARISGVKRLAGGESNVVVIDSELPMVATYGQQLLLRRPYPVGSFAGATVLGTFPATDRQTSKQRQLGIRVSDASPADRIAAWVDLLGEWVVDPQDMELRMGIPSEIQRELIESLVGEDLIAMPVADHLVSKSRIETISRYLEKVMRYQVEETEEAWLEIGALAKRAESTGSAPLVHAVIEQLIDQKRLVKVNKLVAIPTDETALSKKQRARMDHILKMFVGSRTPPTIKEIAAELQTTMDSVASLVRFATQQRILIDLGNGFLIDQLAFDNICRDLHLLFASKPDQTVAEIRDHLKITRKHAIPLLEYCDTHAFTMRQGDTRHAGARLNEHVAERFDELD